MSLTREQCLKLKVEYGLHRNNHTIDQRDAAIESLCNRVWNEAMEEAAKACDTNARICEREDGVTTSYGYIRADAHRGDAIDIRRLKK